MAPWLRAASVRAPLASMTCTVAVSSGTAVLKSKLTWAGAASRTAPSAGSVPSRVLWALAVRRAEQAEDRGEECRSEAQDEVVEASHQELVAA